MHAVLWSSDKGDIPAVLAFKNNLSATTNPGVGDDKADGYEPGSTWINVSAGTTFTCVDSTEGAAVWVGTKNSGGTTPVEGVAAGYKIARGVAAITGTGDVNTGLGTVVAVIVSPQSDPDGVGLAAVSGTIGNQAGAPAAGHVTLKAWKVTAVNDATLIAASAPYNLNWIAIGIA
jgi:hypothetical protein